MIADPSSNGWVLFVLGSDGKRSPADVSIPSFIQEHELVQYLTICFTRPQRREIRASKRFPSKRLPAITAGAIVPVHAPGLAKCVHRQAGRRSIDQETHESRMSTYTATIRWERSERSPPITDTAAATRGSSTAGSRCPPHPRRIPYRRRIRSRARLIRRRRLSPPFQAVTCSGSSPSPRSVDFVSTATSTMRWASWQETTKANSR